MATTKRTQRNVKIKDKSCRLELPLRIGHTYKRLGKILHWWASCPITSPPPSFANDLVMAVDGAYGAKKNRDLKQAGERS